MLCFILLSVICAVSAQEKTDEKINPDDKMKCVNELLNWCKGMQYSQQGMGMSMIATSYQDNTGYHRVFCSSDSDGTNCTRNGSPWYSCTPDHTLTYKGQILAEGEEDVDEDICKTSDQARNQFNFRYDNATLTRFQSDMESFYEEMAALQEQMRELQRSLSNGFSRGGDFWNGNSRGGDFWNGNSRGGDFWNGFPFQMNGPTANPSATTEDSNNIEKE